jgi:hypothetical protein
MIRPILLLLTLIIALSYPCRAAVDEPIALALEWWLRAQNKFDGVSVRTTTDSGGKYYIKEWKVPGVPQPDDTLLEQIVANHKTFLTAENTRRTAKLASIRTRLQLDDEALEMIRNGIR